MAIKPSEYRKRLIKTVVAPSGAEFVIRYVRGEDSIVSIGGLPIGMLRSAQEQGDVYINQEEDVEELKRLLELRKKLVLEGVVEPKIVDKKPEECSDDELSVYELTSEDITFLANAITNFNFDTDEKKEKVASFPNERDADNNRHDGEAVSQVAN